MTKCSIIKYSTQPEAMCGCCDVGPPLDDRNESGGASPMMVHILDLKLMIDAGCRFGPNDLTWEEWEALKHIIIEQNLRAAQAAESTRTKNLINPTHASETRYIHNG